MSAIKVKPNQFSGGGKISSREPDALAAIIRGLAIDNARNALEKSAVPALTDNSGGSPAVALVALPLGASGAIDATSAGGAQTTALSASLVKQSNALQVLTRSVNNARARLGLSSYRNSYGSQASANTIPAQDISATAANGASAVSYASALAAFKAMQSNLAGVTKAIDGVFIALGVAPLALNQGQVSPTLGFSAGAIPALASVAAGPGALAVADATAFLAAFASDLATIAAFWNLYLLGAAYEASLTDSTGGTAAAALAVTATPAAATGAATTSAPKAGFDTQLGVINNVCASLAATINVLLAANGLATLTNSTGGAVSTTLSSISNSLTAVDGSSGSVAVDVVTAAARIATVDNNLSSLGAAVAKLQNVYDTIPLGADALGGAISTTIAAVSATAAGVSGANATMLNTAVNTWLGNTRNNFSTLAAGLNAMLGSSEQLVGLHVVAG